MLAEAIGKLIRQFLLVLGSAGVARGWLTDEVAEQLAGSLAVLIGLGWSWWFWYRGRKNRQTPEQ